MKPDRLAPAASGMSGEDGSPHGGADGPARHPGRGPLVLAVVSILIVVAAGVVVWLQIRPGTHPGAATPTSPATVTPTPSHTVAAGPVPGTLVFLSRPRVDGTSTQLVLTTVANGVQHSVSFGPTDLHDSMQTVSPDLSKVAVVHNPDQGPFASAGDLVVIEPGGARRTVGQAAGGSDYAPIWSPDSTAVMAADLTANHTWYKFKADGSGSTQRGSTVPPPGARFPVWSPNGQYLAFVNRESGLQVVTAVGTVFSSALTYSQWPTADCSSITGCPVSITAVSDNGRYLAVGDRRTSPGPRNPPRFVVDGSNHRVADLPAMAGEIVTMFFTPDYGLLVYTVDYQTAQARFYLITSDYRITQTFTAPYGQIGDLVAYHP